MSRLPPVRHLAVALAVLLFSFLDAPVRARPSLDHMRKVATAPSESVVRAIAGHSHNDYHQLPPLTEALAHGFNSVEADIWLRNGEIAVSHVGFITYGSLRDVYLEPLQERVRRLGSVRGDGAPFTLWIDIKDIDPRLIPALHQLLAKYPMLTSFTDAGPVGGPKPVTVVLTGKWSAKYRYVDSYPLRYAMRDSHVFSEDDPVNDSRWGWYALNWWNYFTWNGHGQMPGSQAEYLTLLVRAIHGKGRRVRFWNAPDTMEVWNASVAAGVDLIETDSLADFESYRSALRPRIIEVRDARESPTDAAPDTAPRKAPGST